VRECRSERQLRDPTDRAVHGWPLASPFAATGRILFDGNGNYTGKTTSSFNGQVIPFDANGTYRVNADCSVAVFEPILGLTFEGELVNGNKEFVLVQSNLGSVTLNILRRQDVSGCMLADLDGTYGIQASGLIVTPTPQRPVFQTGSWTFDGRGGFSGAIIYSLNGNILRNTLTGTYQMKLDPDCSFSVNYADNTGAITNYDGTLFNKGKSFIFIAADQGRVITGEATERGFLGVVDLAPVLQLTNTLASARNPGFLVGDTWRVDVNNAPANAQVYLRLFRNGQDLGVSGPYGGVTDSNGRWTYAGTFDSAAIASWRVEAVVGGRTSKERSAPVSLTVSSSP